MRGQNITTIPDTNAGNAYITVNEGEINVNLVCTVFSSPTNQIQSVWRIQREGIDMMQITVNFNLNGQPTPGEFAGLLFATGDMIPDIQLTYQTHFTFLNFTSQFDTTRLQCGDPIVETRTFIMGFPG